MRRLLPVFWILFGFVFGVLFSNFFLSKKEEPNPVSRTEMAPLMTCAEKTEKAESPISCPKCPCLYSDKILDPPNFDPNLPEVIETNREGEGLVKWTEVPGAKKYSIHVENKNGKTVKTYKGSKLFIYLKDIPLPEGLLEANYFVRLATVNGKDEEGPMGPRRDLHVVPQANVMAPNIQEIKVED